MDTQFEFDDTGSCWKNGGDTYGWPSYVDQFVWFWAHDGDFTYHVLDDFGNLVEVKA